MSRIFRRRSSAILGIDIQPTDLRLAAIARTGSGWRLEGHAIEPLPLNAVVDHRIHDHDSIAHALQQALGRAQVHSKKAAIAIPSSAVMSKRIRADAGLFGQALENFILDRLEQHVPYAVDDVAVDFCVLGTAAGDDAMLDILLVVCPKALIESYGAILDLCKLTPCLIDVDDYALARLCHTVRPEETCVAVLDVSASDMTAKVLRSGFCLHSQRLPLAQANLYQLHESVCDHPIERWWLTGVAPGVSQCCDWLQQIEKTVSVFDPLTALTLQCDQAPAAWQRDAPALGIACGLALGGMAR